MFAFLFKNLTMLQLRLESDDQSVPDPRSPSTCPIRFLIKLYILPHNIISLFLTEHVKMNQTVKKYITDLKTQNKRWACRVIFGTHILKEGMPLNIINMHMQQENYLLSIRYIYFQFWRKARFDCIQK